MEEIPHRRRRPGAGECMRNPSLLDHRSCRGGGERSEVRGLSNSFLSFLPSCPGVRVTAGAKTRARYLSSGTF